MSVINRLSDYIQSKGKSVNKFEAELGFSNGVISKAIRGGKTIGSDKLERIFLTFPELNPAWLLTGNGEMLLSGENQISPSSSFQEERIITIPLYNAEASAGIGALQLNNEYVIDNLQVPFARENDIALTIVGDSMTPAMQSGDIAVVRGMPNWREYLDYGNIFIVVTDNEVYCKTVSKSAEKDIFTLKSYNTNYGDFEIPKKYISEIYKVIGIISQRSY
ncbi:S24 family peptidase [Labilibaculum euxinus]